LPLARIPKIPLNLTLLKGCSIVGVFWGEFTKREPQKFAEEMRQLSAWFADGTIKPHISARFPLDRAVEALQMMAARQGHRKSCDRGAVKAVLFVVVLLGADAVVACRNLSLDDLLEQTGRYVSGASNRTSDQNYRRFETAARLIDPK
jgi:hypothetical protein